MNTNLILSPEEIFKSANISASSCLFCKPNQGMQIHESRNFRLLRVNYPVCPGHLMISSKLHYGSLGELDTDQIQELEEFKNIVGKWFKKNIGSIAFYEHGRAGSCHSVEYHGNQCEHFHLNCLPSKVCLHAELQNVLKKYYVTSSIFEVPELFQKWGNYLYFENFENEAIFYPVMHSKIPPHFFRTLLCNRFQTPHKADWHTHQNFEDFLESYILTQPLQEYFERIDK